MHKIKIILLSMVILFMTSFSVSSAELNPNNPDDYKKFRMNYSEMIEIANPTRLKHRIFYTHPSSGPDAKWFDAVKQGDIETIKVMVENGQDIEVKDEASFGQTALGWAAFIGYEDIVDYLVLKNADLMATDRADVTNVLKSAGLGKNVAVFKKLHTLLADKIDLNNQSNDKQGETILIVASSNDRQEIVRYLLEQGVKTDIITTEKDTTHPAYDQDALSFACSNGNVGTIKLLIEYGAINHRINKPYCDYQ